MKAWVNRGSGFGGALAYAFGEDKGAEIVGGNMSGKTPDELSSEFGVSRRLRSSVERPVWHTSLSMPKGEKLTTGQWNDITRDFMSEVGMNPDNHQYIAIRHSDNDYDHVHIVASRIGLDAKLWLGQFEAKKAIEATQRLEKQHNLTLTPGLESTKGQRNLTKKEIEKMDRLLLEGKTLEEAMPAKMKIQAVIEGATEKETDVFSYIDNLKENGVLAIPNVSEKTGRLSGFSYQMPGSAEDAAFTGRKLGKDFTWPQLQKKVIYEQNRDAKELNERYFKLDEARQQIIDRSDRSEFKAVSSRSRAESELDARGIGSDETERRTDQDRESIDRTNDERASAHRENSSEHGHLFEKNGRNDAGSFKERREADLLERSSDWNDRITDNSNTLNGIIRSDNQSGQISKSVKLKQASFNKMNKALGFKDLEIIIKDRTGKNSTFKYGGEKTFEKLSSLNARGSDIYAKPISDDKYYIVVDDITKDSLKKMREDGYKPNYVQKSSDDNYQAIFVWKKFTANENPQMIEADQRLAANKMVRDLNQNYGDKNFSGVDHPFRVPGFSNQKEGRNKAFTTVSSSQEPGHRDEKLTDRIDSYVKENKRQRLYHEQEARINSPEIYSDVGNGSAKIKFVDEMRSIERDVNMKKQEKDWSVIDYNAAKNVMKNNPEYASEDGKKQIKEAMRDASPGVYQRKHNVDDYVNRTVEKASQDPSVRSALNQRKAEEKAYESRVQKRQERRQEKDFGIGD